MMSEQNDIEVLKARIAQLEAEQGKTKQDGVPPDYRIVTFVAPGGFDLREFQRWAQSYKLTINNTPIFRGQFEDIDNLKRTLLGLADVLHGQAEKHQRVEELDAFQSSKAEVIARAKGEAV